MNDFVVETPEYEGPLDLLLSIVRKNDLSIANLPLAPITAQYLAYIDRVTALDVNLSMEWVEMAARLILWKSASLLPGDPALPDPSGALAQELSRELRELNDHQLAQAKEFLSGRGSSTERSHAHSDSPATTPDESGFDAIPASLWTLRKKAQFLRDVFRARSASKDVPYEPTEDGASVEVMASWTRDKLQHLQVSQWIEIDAWFEELDFLPSKISLFLALLELARFEIICLEQRDGTLCLLRCPPPPYQEHDHSGKAIHSLNTDGS